MQLIGIDEATQSSRERLQHVLAAPGESRAITADLFKLRPDGYDVRDHQAATKCRSGRRWREAGWRHRRWMAQLQAEQRQLAEKIQPPGQVRDIRSLRPPPEERGRRFRPGQGTTHRRRSWGLPWPATAEKDGDHFLALPGDDVKLTFPTAGTPPKAVSDNFTIVDFYESKMSEYDASFVFVPIRKLQELRGMIDPTTGVAMINSIADQAQARRRRQRRPRQAPQRASLPSPTDLRRATTWRDKQVAAAGRRADGDRHPQRAACS